MAKRLRTDLGSTVSAGAKLFIAAPYLWLIGFFLVPFLIVLKISFSETAIAQPPYVPVLDFAAGFRGIRDFVASLSFANYITIAGDDLYVFSYLKSLKVAAVSTAILLLCGLVVKDILRPGTDVVRATGEDDPAGGVLAGAPDRPMLRLGLRRLRTANGAPP